jgi:hypothetical protein
MAVSWVDDLVLHWAGRLDATRAEQTAFWRAVLRAGQSVYEKAVQMAVSTAEWWAGRKVCLKAA